MYFPEGSRKLYTQKEMAYLQRVFASADPPLEQMDEAVLTDELSQALVAGQCYLYYEMEPEVGQARFQAGGITGCRAHAFLATEQLLEVEQLQACQLSPLDVHSLAFVLLPYYWQRYGGTDYEGSWALFTPYSRKQRGVVIAPSVKRLGSFQLTYFDELGLSHSMTVETAWDAMASALSAQYRNPDPRRFEQLVQVWPDSVLYER